jgi:hypothetical protein
MVVTRSRLFLTNILPSTVHVCEINLFFLSWRALYARVLRVLVRSSLMLTCAKCSRNNLDLVTTILPLITDWNDTFWTTFQMLWKPAKEPRASNIPPQFQSYSADVLPGGSGPWGPSISLTIFNKHKKK